MVGDDDPQPAASCRRPVEGRARAVGHRERRVQYAGSGLGSGPLLQAHAAGDPELRAHHPRAVRAGAVLLPAKPETRPSDGPDAAGDGTGTVCRLGRIGPPAAVA